jgi:murein DD-endopeptidase MepM/ murein hydrolase activator NlpD
MQNINEIIEEIIKNKDNLFSSPISGSYSLGVRSFGFRLNGDPKLQHTGVDILTLRQKYAKVTNTVGKGMVIYNQLTNGYGSKGSLGGCVWILHNVNRNPFLVQYGHVDSKLLHGDVIKKGDTIGHVIDYVWVDASGREVPADHLHFSVHLGNEIPSGNWGYRSDLNGWINPTRLFWI